MSATHREPLVSVVVATARGGPFLAEALRSVAAQTYPHVETVLVDDGSEDPDAVRAAAAHSSAVRVVRQERAGVSIARNVGVSLTRGEYLAFLDDDDRWAPTRLERQVESLTEHPTAVVGYCGMRTIDAHGHVLVPADQRQVADVHEVLRRRTGILLPNIVVRREAFDRVGGFHPAFRRAQDLDLVLRLASVGDFVFVDEPLVDYRYHENNVTRAHRELARSIDHVLRLHRWSARERGRQDLVADLDEGLKRNARFAAWSAARAARDEVRAGRPDRAAREVAWAIYFAPGAPVQWAIRRIRGVRAERR